MLVINIRRLVTIPARSRRRRQGIRTLPRRASPPVLRTKTVREVLGRPLLAARRCLLLTRRSTRYLVQRESRLTPSLRLSSLLKQSASRSSLLLCLCLQRVPLPTQRLRRPSKATRPKPSLAVFSRLLDEVDLKHAHSDLSTNEMAGLCCKPQATLRGLPLKEQATCRYRFACAMRKYRLTMLTILSD